METIIVIHYPEILLVVFIEEAFFDSTFKSYHQVVDDKGQLNSE